MPSSPQSPKVSLPPFAVERTFTSLSLEEQTGWGLDLLGVPSAWKVTKGEGVKVAILDAACKVDHVDLAGAVLDDLCRDFSGAGVVDRGTGHGLFVGGIVGAMENGLGILGVAPESKLIFLRCLDNEGSGTMEAVNNALRYCLEIRPDVVNLSLGCEEPDEENHILIKQLYDLGIPAFCASGNDGGAVDYPASYPETIACGGIDKNKYRAGFSSYGAELDLVAPAVSVLSLKGKDQYCRMSGTSFSAPFCAGVACLIIAKHRIQEALTGLNDAIGVEAIKWHLTKYATPGGSIAEVGRSNELGFGVVNPVGSVEDKLSGQ